MSYANRVFKAMRDDIVYDAATLSGITKIDEKSVWRVLYELAKAGAIDCISHDRYRKNRKYQSRQQHLL